MHTRPSFVVALMLSFSCVGAWTQHGAWARETPCVGDCNHDGRLTIDELVTGVTMALGTAPVDRCPDFDPGGSRSDHVGFPPDGEIALRQRARPSSGD
jgi:hypothetical protein